VSPIRFERVGGGAARPGPLARLVAVVALAGFLVLAFVFFWVALAVVGLALIAAPIVEWWRRRRLARARATGIDPSLREADPITGEEPVVIDAEFTPPREPSDPS